MTDAPRRKYVKIPPHIKFLMGAKPFDNELVHLAGEFWEDATIGTPAENGLLIAGHSRCPSRVRAGLGLAWLKHFAAYTGDKCILYPFRTVATPRGVVTYNFNRMPAHRAMCFIVHGRPPEQKPSALHRCGNGHLGCVTPSHLYWGDDSDNHRDMWKHLATGKPIAKGPKIAAPRPDGRLKKKDQERTQR